MRYLGKVGHNLVMEQNEISLHQLKAFNFVRECNRWVTAAEIASNAGIAPRTARLHALKLTNLGIFDIAEVFPAHRYRFSEKARKRNKAFMLRLEKANEVFTNKST